jgi:hypothetical protein
VSRRARRSRAKSGVFRAKFCRQCQSPIPYKHGPGQFRVRYCSKPCKWRWDNKTYPNRGKPRVRKLTRAQLDKKADRNLRRLYGINLAQYDAMLALQDGACAVCGANKGDSRGARFHVDHNHDTGMIRGLLCNLCNRRIIAAHTDGGLLSRASHYVDNPPARSLGLFVRPRTKAK